MPGLKALVVAMGIMILAGVAALAVAIAGRVSHRPAETAPTQPFAGQPIELPAGSRIEAMSTGTDRLVIEVALADGSRQLVVIDLASGRRLGTIPLRIAP
jgi:hypothetical protein